MSIAGIKRRTRTPQLRGNRRQDPSDDSPETIVEQAFGQGARIENGIAAILTGMTNPGSRIGRTVAIRMIQRRLSEIDRLRETLVRAAQKLDKNFRP